MKQLFSPLFLLRLNFAIRYVASDLLVFEYQREGEEENEQYCRICPTHTLCRYLSEDYGSDCLGVEDLNLETPEMAEVLHLHNKIRSNNNTSNDKIAQGKELRGNPGPQPPARNMLQMAWDEELAFIARRWALQCRLEMNDVCRDVERFNVWQNVNVLRLKEIDEKTTSFMRLGKHIDTWLNEVNDFDAAKVGLIKPDNKTVKYSAYLALASAKTHRIGCSRIVYRTLSTFLTEENDALDPGARVEVFICNYGPMDRTVAEPLYEFGVPGFCPSGTVPSTEYRSLCLKSSIRRDLSDAREKEESVQELRDSPSSSPALRITVSLLLIRILVEVIV